MKQGHRAAFYICFQGNGFQFITYDLETDTIKSSSSPHAATLFTSGNTGEEIAKRATTELGPVVGRTVCMVPCRTNEPNIIVG